MVRLFLDLMARGGGVLMWTIFLVSVVIWTIGIGKWASLARFQGSRRRFLKALKQTGIRGTGDRDYDELLDKIALLGPGDAQRFHSLFRQFLLGVVPRLNRGFSTMSAWIAVAPLLGLLGTVMGMIRTFDVITNFGVGNPNLTAEGISVALLTTQAGLTVAFPGVILHSLLANRKNGLMARIMKDGEELLSRLGAPAHRPQKDANP